MKKVIRLTERDLTRIVKRTIKEEEEIMRGYEDLPDNPWNDELQDDLDYDNRMELSQLFKNLAREIEDAPAGTSKGEFREIQEIVNEYLKSAKWMLKAIKLGKNISDVEEDKFDDFV